RVMADDNKDRTDRRSFLQAGALATASAVSCAPALQAQHAAPSDTVLPRRKLGRTGVELTLLEQGAVRGGDRILRLAFANGIRVFDTAKIYGTEPLFKRWFDQAPEVRKQIFLVTKDMPRTPKNMLRLVDERLASLGTDYIDLYFIHGLGDDSRYDAIELVKSK